MVIGVNNKEYKIKFGYEATAKSGILKKMAVMESKVPETDEDAVGIIEDILITIAELLLVGLQKNYKSEFGFDYNDEASKDEAMAKVFDMIDDMSEEKEDFDIKDLYAELQQELISNGFLAGLLQKEQAKAKKTVAKK